MEKLEAPKALSAIDKEEPPKMQIVEDLNKTLVKETERLQKL